MKAYLELECIGDDTRAHFRLWTTLLPEARSLGRNPVPSPWVARIIGPSPHYGWEREFLRPSVDYSRANSIGSRGVFRSYWLEDGEAYEVFARRAWGRSERYFCRVTDGKITRIPAEEVAACLSAR